MKQHKHLIGKALALIVAGSYLGYLISLIMAQTTFTTTGGIFTAIPVILIALFIAINFGLQALYVKNYKLITIVLGIITIFIAHQVFINNPEQGLHAGDITKVFGVFLVIAGATGILLSKQAKEELKESKMEVIEV